jgi:hypothetical protein
MLDYQILIISCWIFTTFQELPLGIPLNSEKLSLFSDSEHYQAK